MKKLLIIILVAFSAGAFAQTGIGTTTPDASAQLEVSSTTKGFLPPRMTEEQRGLIASPAAGLLVYQTDGTSGYYFYTGATWLNLQTQLVNDLTTGGTGAALTAEQGKTLQTNKLDKTQNFSGDVSGTYSNLQIAANAVTTTEISNGTIAAADLSAMGASSGDILEYSGSAWAPVTQGLKLVASVTNSGTISFTRRLGYTYRIIVLGGSSAGSSVNCLRINNYSGSVYKSRFYEYPWSSSNPIQYYQDHNFWVIGNINGTVPYNTQIILDMSFLDATRIRYNSSYVNLYYYGNSNGLSEYNFAGSTASSVSITFNFGQSSTWTWGTSTPASISVYEYQK